MNIDKFKDPRLQIYANPIDSFNLYGDLSVIKQIDVISNDIMYNNKKFAVIRDIYVDILIDINIVITKTKICNFLEGQVFTKFQLYTILSFNNDFYTAMNSLILKDNDILPYIRVGTDYFKIIKKYDTTNNKTTEDIKNWKKEEIKQDYGINILNRISKFDDFVMSPSNIEYKQIINGCYNLYKKLPFLPVDNKVVTLDDMPTINILMKRVFGSQIDVGFKYLKLLYQYPTKKTYILCLVSYEKATGKTTFLNFIQDIFGENFIQLSLKTLEDNFNGGYALKNIIAVDEAFDDKKSMSEKFKNLSTQTKITVNNKFTQHYTIPFFSRFILCSNKEHDFIKIEDNDNRYWVRKLEPIPDEDRDGLFDEKLRSEIPLLLKYLLDLPELDFSKYRFALNPDEIWTNEVDIVKKESQTWLCKELESYITDCFLNEHSTKDELYLMCIDIKDKWYRINNNVNEPYIRKVLNEELKIEKVKSNGRYYPFNDIMNQQRIGKYYIFKREDFVNKENEIETTEDNNEVGIYQSNNQVF